MVQKTPGAPQDDKGAAPIRAHVLFIEARFYEDIADLLIEGAVAECAKRGVTFERISVPGALEIPQVLAAAAEARAAGRAMFDGALALGCVIRGETAHYDIVCNNANHWLMDVAMHQSIPVGNAILTVDTRAQALARAEGGINGKGGDAARACLRLIETKRAFWGAQA
ncbi:6,7-dimethyl-8-ribityllumazine synthase [Hyphomicrobium sp.]|jgi:6,7-dimethyl-8-ribityllumazine synthase|uniref:6,7-dimethyl-8-ribityllumazine synthase n=1 Tax=Hyphomicrobium sp. TaxID=82 RepID=UPI003567EC54